MKKCIHLLFLFFIVSEYGYSQQSGFPFPIRTITAGVTLKNLSDTATLNQAIIFLKKAKSEFNKNGYEVQTLRIATSNFYSYSNGVNLGDAIPFLKKFDELIKRNGVILSIGQILPPDQYESKTAEWASNLVSNTSAISFNLAISSSKLGIHTNSIKVASEIILALSHVNNGEANFRFTASANCPAGIPFFPAAYHEGVNSFAIGLESANLLTQTFKKTEYYNAKQILKASLEEYLTPIQVIANRISASSKWKYDGIDVSPAPGLNASIGKAIETFTKQPFGSPSTLRACALITDVLKALNVKKCGYSGLMLPVVEDSVLAQRAMENRYTLKELLLYSAVSGTGLDVVPIAGDTPLELIEGILSDVAALSLKYTSKALSARLFPIPNKKTGERITFESPFLTGTIVMRIE